MVIFREECRVVGEAVDGSGRREKGVRSIGRRVEPERELRWRRQRKRMGLVVAVVVGDNVRKIVGKGGLIGSDSDGGEVWLEK